MMKILKSKKGLMSVCSIMVAVALIAGSTFAWFTSSAAGPEGDFQAGTLKVVFEQPTNFVPVPDNNLGLQPGDYVTGVNVGNLPARPTDPTDPDYAAEMAAYEAALNAVPNVNWGHIKNEGTLPMLVKVNQNIKVTCNRNANGDVVANYVMPKAQNGVIFGLTIPLTTKNMLTYNDMSTGATGPDSYVFQFVNRANGEVYFLMDPGTDLQVDCVIDMKTNASDWYDLDASGNKIPVDADADGEQDVDAKGFPVWKITTPNPRLLDNRYQGCIIDASQNLSATQGLMLQAWKDLFNVTPEDLDFANDPTAPHGGFGTMSAPMSAAEFIYAYIAARS